MSETQQHPLQALIGGPRGAIESILPPLAFIATYVATGDNMTWAVSVAVGLGLFFAIWRLVERKRPTRVLGALLVVVLSAYIADKLRIAQRLDELGVAYIEGGWPGSNPKDVEFFHRAGQLRLRQARIAAFGATCHAGSRPDADANLLALLDAHTPVCTVVGKSWLLHRLALPQRSP